MRLTAIIDVLCATVAARGAKGALAGPLTILLWTRLRRAAARFRSLARRIETGTLRPPRPDYCRNRNRTPADAGAKIPRGFAWLLAPIPEAAATAGQLRHFFADPETESLLASDPRFGRILRPLCRTIGLKPPPAIAPPRQKSRAPDPNHARKNRKNPPPEPVFAPRHRAAPPASIPRAAFRRHKLDRARAPPFPA